MDTASVTKATQSVKADLKQMDSAIINVNVNIKNMGNGFEKLRQKASKEFSQIERKAKATIATIKSSMSHQLFPSGFISPDMKRSMTMLSAMAGPNLQESTKGIRASIAGIYPGGSVEKQMDTIRNATQKAEASVVSFSRNAGSALHALSTNTRAVMTSFVNFRNVIAGVAVGLLVKNIVDATTALQRMKSTLLVATESMAGANAEMEYITETSKYLGLDLQSAAHQLAKLQVAAKGTELEGQGVRDIFEAIAMAGTAMGLGAEQVAGSIYAVQQMMSKGRVATEELRRQWGEQMPGAFRFAAQAMNMTMQELDKAIENGEVYAEVLLPRMAKVLKEEFGPALPVALRNLQAELNRLQTALFQTKLAASDASFGDKFAEAIRAVTASFENFITAGYAEKVGKTLGTITEYATGLIREWGKIPDVLNENNKKFEIMARAIEGAAASLVILGAAGGIAAAGFGLVGLAGGGVSAVIALAAALVGLGVAFRKVMTPINAFDEEINTSYIRISNLELHINRLSGELGNYAQKETLLWHEKEKVNSLFEEMIRIAPTISSIYDKWTKGAISLAEAEKLINKEKKIQVAFERYDIALAEFAKIRREKEEWEKGEWTYDPMSGASVMTRGSKAPQGTLEKYDKSEKRFQEQKKWLDIALATSGDITNQDEFNKLVEQGTKPFKKPSEKKESVDEGVLKKATSTYEQYMQSMIQNTITLEGELNAMHYDGAERRIRIQETEWEAQKQAAEYQHKQQIKTEGLSQVQIDSMTDKFNDVQELKEKTHLRKLAEIHDNARDEERDKAQEELDKLEKESKRLAEIEQSKVDQLHEMYDPAFLRQKSMDYLNQYGSGLSTMGQDMAKKEVELKVIQMQEDQVLSLGTAWEGAQVAMAEYSRMSQEYAMNTYNAWQNIISQLESTFTQFLTGQKVNFMQFIQEINAQIIQMGIVRPLLGAAFGLAGAAGGGGGTGGNVFDFINPGMGGGAWGADAEAGKPLWVGERGRKELFVPSVNGRIYPDEKLKTSSKASLVFSPNITVNGGNENTTRDVKKVLRREGQKLIRAVEEGKRDK